MNFFTRLFNRSKPTTTLGIGPVEGGPRPIGVAKHDSGDRITDYVLTDKDVVDIRAMCIKIAKETNSENGETPLHWAAMGGFPSAVEDLIREGAVVDAMANDRSTPLHYACAGAYTREIVTNELTRRGQGKLAQAWTVAFSQGFAVEALIRAGANVNAKTAKGLTPLLISADHGEGRVIEVLILAGADMNMRDVDGDTALKRAVLHDHGAAVDALARAGANVREKDEKDKTLLHLAAMFGYASAAAALITSGAEIDARENSGMTPLHWAAMGAMLSVSGANYQPDFRGHASVAEALVRAGANLTVRDEKGKTALGTASDQYMIQRVPGYAAVAKVLQRAGAAK
jgi:ankyrin repeat protein